MKGEIRYRIERRKLSYWQRIGIYFRKVVEAIREIPESEYPIWIEVKEGEFGYDSAPLVSCFDPHPIRYVVTNGKYVRVNQDEG